MNEANTSPTNFIRNIISEDVKNNKNNGHVVTRFPPEPNGYLHIGHAKSICLNFGIANDYEGGKCHLRFDDTNPSKEDVEYMDAIIEDVKWLGFEWGNNLFHASDYFEQLYDYAVQLIKLGKAYVCSLNADEIREYRGTLKEPGKNSPFRDRTVQENLDLFQKMRNGEFEEGEHVLRAKIDMASPNLNMRDPAIYRIKKVSHHRTGDKWCMYPMYDFAHGLSDSIEGITHSICTLEFEDHRPLYDWILDELGVTCHPQQIEFARLNLQYTELSKRKLIELVKEKIVEGWDDPRLPTLIGLRRRGYPSSAIRNFCDRIGVSKKDSRIEFEMLEDCVRDELNQHAPRVMCVLDPLKVIITNYPEGKTEELDIPNHPQNPDMGTREVPFSREIFIEKDDFLEDPPKKFFRLAPGREVRLRSAYYITCNEVIKDDQTGKIKELRCTYDPLTKGGSSPDGRKVKATLHWVSAAHGLDVDVRLYDRLFTVPNPSGEKEGTDFTDFINPDSLVKLSACKIERSIIGKQPGTTFQFERQGYFCMDTKDTTTDKVVFNRTATLRDTWAKIAPKADHVTR
ncbi:MAG: glutamine--tRNA ligase/YqeY domain fusion protein [Proteobacteria bacterium]|nr:glutamine--tRNA ligase/YqeY domain fusion protein [Pseudomonadota bacterium]